MTGQYDPRDDFESALPEGWQPADDDRDPALRAVAELAREADEPLRMPAPAEFETMRIRVMAGLAEHDPAMADDPDLRPAGRVVAVPPAALPRETEPSLGRVLLVGGGPVGQLLRLAAVGAVAFVLGGQLIRSGESPVIVADTPGISIADAPASAPDPVEVADAGPLGAPAQQSGWRSGEIIYRSLHDELAAPGSLGPAARTTGVVPVTTSDNDWFLQSHFGSGGASNIQGGSYTARELVDALQQLRVHAELTGDSGASARVRQLEQSLRPIIEDTVASDAATARALSSMETADRFMQAGRHADALEAWREVVAEAPRTTLSLAAQLQSARVMFDELGDFEGSLGAYRDLLRDYPAQMFTPAQRDHVVQRVDLLARNSADDWLAVRLWQDARRASATDARRAALKEILVRTPRSPLAAHAAQELAADITRATTRVAPDRIEAMMDLMDSAIKNSGNAPHAAAFQFARAEIALLGMFDRELATAEYRKVLALPGAGEYASAARARLGQLQR